jgi:hypothetical protein
MVRQELSSCLLDVYGRLVYRPLEIRVCFMLHQVVRTFNNHQESVGSRVDDDHSVITRIP